MKMRWFAGYSAALAMAAGCTHLASAQAQPVPQAPASQCMPVTADNFNRAETDLYLGRFVKGGRIGTLSHRRELYLNDSPVVRPNRDTLKARSQPRISSCANSSRSTRNAESSPDELPIQPA